MMKVIVGITPESVLTAQDIRLLGAIGQGALTTFEYVFALWEMFGDESNFDHIYEYVTEGLDHVFSGPNALTHPAGLKILEGAPQEEYIHLVTSAYVKLLMRLHKEFYRHLRNLPEGQGEMNGPIETVTVDSITSQYTVLNFFYEKDTGYSQFSTSKNPWDTIGRPEETI